ncbi:DMT family transporter [Thermococcus argininiproducens]|uniref:DMT family transporter n=1 Tax=Thermococcus argininiproducens TaxID=2866384 RepID=A0A9E7M8R9_9EURY|nr:DMT family transporter [Thermococcus argininiproducens]USG99474.1 DMT family transporter [Thermococcus argininiproducens]
METLFGALLALVAAFGWGTSSVLIKVGMRKKSAITVNIIRLYITVLSYLVLFIFTGSYREIVNLSWKLIVIAFISGQFGFVVGDYFYFSALRIMGVSRTVPITSSYPLWTILWTWLFLGRQINIQIVLGAFLVFLAIIIVRKGEIEEHLNPKGFIFALLAPISWSIAIVLLDFLSSQISPISLAGIRLAFAAMGVSLFLPKYSMELKKVTKKEIALLSAAALLGLIIGQYAFVKSVSSVGSQISAPVSAINPIISSALAMALLKEPPNRKIILGLILAVTGVILITTA